MRELERTSDDDVFYSVPTRTDCSGYIWEDLFFVDLDGDPSGEIPRKKRFAAMQRRIAEREATMCSDQEYVLCRPWFESKFKKQLQYEKENVARLMDDKLPLAELFECIFN